MANYSNLKAAINAVIKQNGQGEITGEVMNQVLTAMVNSLGSNYLFAGVATPSTNPGTPDQNIFYMATQAGTYTNFSAIVLQAGISILLWDGSWSNETFYTIDSVPTAGSNNFISSGAVFDRFKLDGGAYDVSAHNNNQTFASLSALLSDANLSTLIPTNIRSGGMSIKFVQTSDNKYVQYRLMLSEFTDAQFANPANWQGVANEPVAGSMDLATSNAVFAAQNEVIAQSRRIRSTSNDLLSVNITSGETFKVMANVSGTFTRLIINYNEQSNKRLIDSDTAGDFSNQELVFVASENITVLGLYLTGDCIASLSLIKYPGKIQEAIQIEKERAEASFNKLELIDAADSTASKNLIDLTLRKNDGTTQNPDYRTLTHLQLPSVATEKSGLAPAKSEWDTKPFGGSSNFVSSNGVFSMIKGVIAQSPIIRGVEGNLLSVNIGSGEKFKVIVNTSGTFTRLILTYNGTAEKRLIDSSEKGDFSNKPLTFTAPENITVLGLYIAGDCKGSISLLESHNIDDSINDINKRINNLLFGDNILLKQNSLCYHNAYYNTTHIGGEPNYTFFAFPVESGKTYRIYPKVRFISKDGVNIQGESTKEVSYTADFTGTLYVTFFNNSKNWIVTEKDSFVGIAGYDTIARTTFENKRGISDLYAVHQLGLRDVVAEYVYGSKNLISTALCKDGYYYNSSPSASNSYLYFKIALEANVDYYISPGIRYISKEGENIAAYPNLSNSYIVFTPDTSTNYYFTYNKGEDVTGYFIGKKQGFIHPNTLFAKKWVSCGDSFTQGDFTGATGVTTFSNMPYVGKKMVYPYFIGRRCGMNIVNEAISGSAMAYIDGTKNEFSKANGRYTQLPEDADYITLWFGINDSHQNVPIGTIDDNVNTTFYGAWNIVMDYLISHHPNAKIGIIISNGCDTTAYPVATRNIAKKWGVSYLDLNGDYKVPLMLRTNEKTEVAASILQSILEKQSVNYPSNQHPNVAAHEYESYFIESWLKSL